VSTQALVQQASERETDVRPTSGRAIVAAAYKPSRREEAAEAGRPAPRTVARSDFFSWGAAESPSFLRIPGPFVKQECSLDPAQSETVTHHA